MTNGALLDGKLVPAEAIDPARHRFLGTFRPAKNTLIPPMPAFTICPCGQVLQTLQCCWKHYNEGHIDMPQYVTIEKGHGA